MCTCALEGAGGGRGGGGRKRMRAAGGAGQRKEEQMRYGGRGGGPKAIVHVLLWTKGSSGSVCKPTAGFSPLTRPHAGHSTSDWLPQSRPFLLPVLRLENFLHRSSSGGVLCWYVASSGPIRFYARSVHTGYHHGSVNINFLIGLLCR